MRKLGTPTHTVAQVKHAQAYISFHVLFVPLAFLLLSYLFLSVSRALNNSLFEQRRSGVTAQETEIMLTHSLHTIRTATYMADSPFAEVCSSRYLPILLQCYIFAFE